MSVLVTTAVWKYAPYRGGDLLVLLGLADHADDSGVCCPKVEFLAKKCRLSVRMVLRHLARYRADGILWVETGGGPDNPTKYHINLERMTRGGKHDTGKEEPS